MTIATPWAGTLTRPAVRSPLGAALLILPMVLFLGVAFFIPLAGMLAKSVEDSELATVMPRTVKILTSWNGDGLPPDDAYEAVIRDLSDARQAKTAGTAARRLSYDNADLRGLILGTARNLPADLAGITWREALVSIDPAWGEPTVWQTLRRASGPVTDFYLLAALDLRRGADGSLHQAPEESRLYGAVLLRTFIVAFTVTAICLFLALPLSHLMASTGPLVSSLVMLVLLLPLWTSILVRSAAWLVILQTNGIVNQLLTAIHAIGQPLDLVYNRTGVVIALTHILLPYAALPLYAAMKALPASQMRAASSLGAGPVEAFFRIYLPQISPGLSAGGLLVFILALGYYITPLLLGGAGDQLLPFYIAFNTSQALNWGLASALGSILLAATLVLYTIYVRLVGVDRIGLG